MPLITPANMQQWTDYIGAVYNLELAQIGTSSGSAVPGTARNEAAKLLSFTVALADIDQEQDLNLAANAFAVGTNVEAMFQQFQNVIAQLDQHCLLRGNQVVGSGIIDLPSYLSYYNGGSGGALFANMLTPSFAVVYNLTRARALPPAGVLSWGINPLNGNASGMGTNSVGGAFAAGAAVNALYSAVNPIVVVTTNFNGTGASTLALAGTDHTGAAMTWTVAGVGVADTALLTQQTISSGAITAQTKVNVTVGSSAGYQVGSVLTINSGLPDQEQVVVQAVPDGTHFTAVFLKAHGVSAKVDGNRAYAATPATAGRRLVTLTGITITPGTGVTTGAVRVEGVQDRVAI